MFKLKGSVSFTFKVGSEKYVDVIEMIAIDIFRILKYFFFNFLKEPMLVNTVT